jgi:hypothetical protein
VDVCASHYLLQGVIGDTVHLSFATSEVCVDDFPQVCDCAVLAQASLAFVGQLTVPSVDVRQVCLDAACRDAPFQFAVTSRVRLWGVVHPFWYALPHLRCNIYPAT